MYLWLVFPVAYGTPLSMSSLSRARQSHATRAAHLCLGHFSDRGTLTFGVGDQ